MDYSSEGKMKVLDELGSEGICLAMLLIEPSANCYSSAIQTFAPESLQLAGKQRKEWPLLSYVLILRGTRACDRSANHKMISSLRIFRKLS